MDESEIFILYFSLITVTLSYIVIKRLRRKRKYGVRPINLKRNEKGMFNNLIKAMLEKDHRYFFKYTRMTPHMFYTLLQLMRRKLQKDKTKNPLPPAHRLIITLHYLAEGCSMQELAFGHYIGLATVSCIIKETTKALWDILSPIYLKVPIQEDWASISSGFLQKWNMPNCLGAVDGKHVHIQAPKNVGSDFFCNYKKRHSIVLMACCDSAYKFTLVDVGAAGSNHDSVVFRESGFGHAILNGKFNIPEPQKLPSSHWVVPNFFVADAAFPLHENIMRPYPGQKLLHPQRVFNYRLSRARRTIENAFGILSQRWRILRRDIQADLGTIENIVLATLVLHNFLMKNEEEMHESEKQYCPSDYADSCNKDGLVKPGAWRSYGQLQSVSKLGSNNSKRNSKNNRDILCEYLSSPSGAVSWQDEYVLRGSVPPNFTMEFA